MGAAPMEAPAHDNYYGTESDAEEQAREAADTVVVAGAAANGAPFPAPANRKLVFRANLRLRVEDTRAAIADVRQWAEARGGFIEQVQVFDSEDGGRGNIVVRIPQEAYEETLTHLRGLAVEVLSDSSERVDVTSRYADMDARLDNLKAAEAELREMMAEVREAGGDAEDVLAIFNRLTEIRGQIDGLQAQLDALSEQVALSTINVEFEPVPAPASVVARRWRPGEVFRRARADLVERMESLIDATIYFVVAVAPVLLLLAILLWIAFLIVRWICRSIRAGFGRLRARGSGEAEAE